MSKHTSPEEHWQRIEALLDGALDLPPEQRPAFLREACGTDRQLLEQVSRLLQGIDDPDPRLDSHAMAYAAELVAEPVEDPGAHALPDFDRFRIIREIGRGGMGTVYLAERSDFHQRVALKLVRAGLDVDARTVQRFREERQILASLEHPNIARLLDGGVTRQGVPYFVMEYVEGAPIDRFCDERTLTIRQRLELFAETCDAVEHAHDRGIVHRDLKPSNILVTDDRRVKLLDFGIAKLVVQDAAAASLTRTGHRLMTPDYASPEQVRGEPVTLASDVYALGVLLYELLTGRRPYDVVTPTPHELERAILEQEPSRPSSSGARALEGDLDAIVLKAMRKEPERRYRSAGALAEDIRRHLHGHAITARPDTLGYRARRFIRRRRTLAAAALAAIVLSGSSSVVVAAWVRRAGASARGTVIAVGSIEDGRRTAAASARSLSDMLATNLARAEGLRVVSTPRMYELLGADAVQDGQGAGDLTAAARMAGATRLLEGSVTPDGTMLRLELRLIDVRRGKTVRTFTVDAPDLFALADAATSRVATTLGLEPPGGSVADVTTRSEVAYRLYEEGLRALNRSALDAAARLFGAALAEDSTFAMAAFYYARSAPAAGAQEVLTRLERAHRLAQRASAREALMIRAYRAWYVNDPALLAIADSLAARYPDELEGPLYAARALQEAARYPEALRRYRRIVALDSLAFQANTVRCIACEAQNDLISTLMYMDSFPSAEREARLWTRLQPASSTSWLRLGEVLVALGYGEQARAAYLRAAALEPTLDHAPTYFGNYFVPFGEFAIADSALMDLLPAGPEHQRHAARWYFTISLRNQGRVQQAFETIHALRSGTGIRREYLIHEAQVLLEKGEFRHAAALFDSLARTPWIDGAPSSVARHKSWMFAHESNALAAAGDSARLRTIIDSLQATGEHSNLARDQRLHHHARGLLYALRGGHEAAVEEFRSAMFASTGYIRTNYELARSLLSLGRAQEAVATLQDAMRTSIEGPNLYVTRTELHELLAQAFDELGAADSAVAHYRAVAHAWKGADPPFRPRLHRAERRIVALQSSR